MNYNFDQRIDRTGTASYKWDQSEKLFGRPDILPLWVADMDFEPPVEVIEAIQQRAQHPMYGYTIRTQEYYDAVRGWLQRRHNWVIQDEWVTTAPGIVPALSLMVQAFTDPGDQVILQSPVYYPFYDVIRMNGRTIVDNPLVERNGKFEIDFALLEEQARNGAKLMLLCTPHNPGGRVWTREELIRVGEICLKYGVLVVADEIHHDLVFSDHKHTPFASISEAFAQQSMTCIATSKTFNLAGLQAGTVIIPNTELRRKYNYLLKTLSIHMETCFGQAAVISSYNSGDEWLDQLLPYLEANRDYIIDYLAVNLPLIRVMKPEGTYLIWLDCRAISDDPKVLRRIMFEDAGVAFSEGSVFGKQGIGWLRINFACPRSIVIEALDRFAEAVRKAKPL